LENNPENFEFQIMGKSFLCQNAWLDEDEFLGVNFRRGDVKNRLITFSIVAVCKPQQYNKELIKSELKQFVETIKFMEETSYMMTQDLNIIQKKINEFKIKVMTYKYDKYR
jgi:hypothetical protein